MSSILMEGAITNIKKIISSIEVKKQYLVNEYATIDSIRGYDYYHASVLGTDSFEMHKYDYNFIHDNTSGLTDDDIIKYASNNSLIPMEYRDGLLQSMRKFLMTNYNEQNRYYRTLLGLPNGTDEIYFYNNIPIHLLDERSMGILINTGEMDNIINNNPDKPYLKFIKNKINNITLHDSEEFALLYFDESDDDNINRLFIKIYNECRVYVLAQYYNEELSFNSPEYYGFIGISILFMTINRLISEYYTVIARYDFYDKTLIKMLFNSYGVRYYDDIPMKYQRLIIRNLNSLLKNSGIDKIYILIHELFAFKNVEMFKYYLSKSHKFDNDGNPIYNTKTVTDIDNTQILVEDVSENYDMYFIRVPISTDKFSNEVGNIENIVPYDEIVQDDPYWGNGYTHNDFRDKLLQTDFSLKETKYVGMDARYKVDVMNFEINYFFQMIKDLKSKISSITINLENILSTDVKLFDAFTLLLHLICKKFNYSGNIRNSAIMNLSTVYGFNYKADLSYINSLIPDDFKYDFKIPLDNLNNDSLSELFSNNKDFYYYLVDRMYTTKDKKEYDILKKLYRVTCIKYSNNECYQVHGETINTFLDYIKISNPHLHSYIVNVTDNEIDDIIEYVCITLDDMFSDCEIEYIFSNLPNITIDLIKMYMKKITNFFMSYKADLRFFTTSYVISDKLLNTFKVLDDITFTRSNLELTDSIDLSNINELISDIHAIREEYESIGLTFDINILGQVIHTLLFNILDVGITSKVTTCINDLISIGVIDEFGAIVINDTSSDNIIPSDDITSIILDKLKLNFGVTFEPLLKILFTFVDDFEDLNLSDVISGVISDMDIVDENIVIGDSTIKCSKFILPIMHYISDSMYIYITNIIHDDMNIKVNNTVTVSTLIENRIKINIENTCDVIKSVIVKNMLMDSSTMISSNILSEMLIDYMDSISIITHDIDYSELQLSDNCNVSNALLILSMIHPIDNNIIKSSSWKHNDYQNDIYDHIMDVITNTDKFDVLNSTDILDIKKKIKHRNNKISISEDIKIRRSYSNE